MEFQTHHSYGEKCFLIIWLYRCLLQYNSLIVKSIIVENYTQNNIYKWMWFNAAAGQNWTWNYPCHVERADHWSTIPCPPTLVLQNLEISLKLKIFLSHISSESLSQIGIVSLSLSISLFMGPFSLFSSFQYSWQLNVQYNFCQWLDSNWGPEELEATALPAEPQPLPTSLSLPLSLSPLYLVNFQLVWFAWRESRDRKLLCGPQN